MKYCFIINPGSNHNKSARFIPLLLAELDRRKLDYEYQLTTSLNDARQLSQTANEQGYDVVVAVGGDGTINRVINGFYDENGRRNSNARLGVIHTGTSPDFCKSYGIPTQPLIALETLLKGHSKAITIARTEYHTQAGERRIGYFACCANVGLGAQVARTSNQGIRKYLGDGLGTFASILIALCGYRPSNLPLLCDGKAVVVKNNFNTFIGKTMYVASGMKVVHDLTDADERLYVLSLKQLNLLNIVPALRAIYSGKANYDKHYLSFYYARSIEIMQGHTNNEMEFDGDPRGFLPCRIAIAPDKLELIVNEL